MSISQCWTSPLRPQSSFNFVEEPVSRQLADGNSWRKMELGARPYATVADAFPGLFSAVFAKRFDTAKWKNDLPCSCFVLNYNYHIFNYK
jgi:hypothetical protein